MAITNKNQAKVDKKEFQFMTPAPVASGAAMFVIGDQLEDNISLYVTSATVHYLYHHDEDSYVQIPSGALTGTFGAGACGIRAKWSATVTANGGSTTTATTTGAITGLAIGRTIRFLTGLNAGREAVCTGVIINPGGTSTLQFAALPSTVATTDTFVVDTPRFFVLSAGTLAAGCFKSYDTLTGTWSGNLSITNLPATVATDGQLVATPSDEIFATGTATAGASTTLTNSAKTWTTNQWTNYQVRIVSGTGIGQIRTIASNTATVLTVSSAWTTNPDATSVYNLEGNQDFIYFLGNGAVTMYRYSISGNTWTVMAPTTARAAAPSTGMSANWIGKSGDANWANESDIKDGRYIYSFRGGAAATLDRFDIAGGTAGAGAWVAITYANQAETFTTGSSYAVYGRYIIIRKDATHRYFKYSVRGNYLEPLTVNLFPDSTAVLGNKIWINLYKESGVEKIAWLYSLGNTLNIVNRVMLY